jgi:hypothetical protein
MPPARIHQQDQINIRIMQGVAHRVAPRA